MTAEILDRVPAGNPRGNWTAEERAQQLRNAGRDVEVVMDLPSDSYLIVASRR
jgi:hypothetical protein